MNGDYCSSSSEPHKLPLQYLKEITDNFSDKLEIGQGGFSVVYKGVQPNGGIVAVKKLLQNPTLEEQFKNEVDLLMRLEHPNIVRLEGYCYEIQNEHLHFEGKHVFGERIECLLCLEYLPKGSLARFLSDPDSRADWRTCYKIIEGICNGLQYLHEQPNGPITHLDLKPSNILLSDAFVPKITDFGLSRLLDRQETMYTVISGGTLGYMPPEYLQGILTPMSDIFSLGVIIWEIVMGQRTYPDETISFEEFIEHELQKWRNMLQLAPGNTMLEIDQQIRRCIEIGKVCMNHSRFRRPTMTKVIKMLQGLESTDCDVSNDAMSPAFQIRSGAREFLYVYPNELSFSLELDRRIRCIVKLTNITDEYVAFYFKATRATNNYRIEPARGYLSPKTMTYVDVTMEETGELLPSDLQRDDEFLVQSFRVREHRVASNHITEDTFNTIPSNAVHKVHLSVVHVPPTQATSQELVQHSEATLDALQSEGSQGDLNGRPEISANEINQEQFLTQAPPSNEGEQDKNDAPIGFFRFIRQGLTYCGLALAGTYICDVIRQQISERERATVSTSSFDTIHHASLEAPRHTGRLPIISYREDSYQVLLQRKTTKSEGGLHPDMSLRDVGTRTQDLVVSEEHAQVLLQRLAHFSNPAFDNVMTENDSCEITYIESLFGCTGRRCIMGVILQSEDYQFYLKDLTGAVPIDLANAEIASDFLVQISVMVAEGELLSNGIFQVEYMCEQKHHFHCLWDLISSVDVSYQLKEQKEPQLSSCIQEGQFNNQKPKYDDHVCLKCHNTKNAPRRLAKL